MKEVGHKFDLSFPVAKAKTETQSISRFTVSIDENKLVPRKNLLIKALEPERNFSQWVLLKKPG